ncbi:MAG TPA: DUF2452 domain-containing protein [Flavitalea sp.]|nr:DUF2452 domain-containing protein [Flavitalea sp.]
MIEAYNFTASWQLFPEKGIYESGERPRSGTCKISPGNEGKELQIEYNWVSLENHAFNSSYKVIADGQLHGFEKKEIADEVQALFPDGISFELHFYRSGTVILHVLHEIMPNGYMKISQQGRKADDTHFTNVEIYHKQMSVLPYSSSIAGAVIRPTEEGVIRHKALTAMEEQTNMQLMQIRKQIELLALQAQEIQKRKDLSLIIYGAKLNFSPVIGQTYYLYQKSDESYVLSLVSPKEWGRAAGPFKSFVGAVKLLADHTWQEL